MMKNMVLLSLVILLFSCNEDTRKNSIKDFQNVVLLDSPLRSWRGVTRERILTWIDAVTDSTGKDFIPERDRIAVFDNDGTLWPEQPIPNQLAFAMDFLQAEKEKHPEWSKDGNLAGYINGDQDAIRRSGKKGLARLMAISHGGLTEAEFNSNVQQWVDSAKDKKFGRRYKELVYQPMLELLQLLRDEGFKIFIVSGGGADFMRVWTEEVYGIPPYQVVGSYSAARFDIRDSSGVITKLPQDLYVDDKEGKPVAIHRFIGKHPVFCGGNSDGDLAMMQYTASGKYRSMNVLLHHTDNIREYAYDLKTISGHLEKALAEARSRGWVIVDMKNDFHRVFPFED